VILTRIAHLVDRNLWVLGCFAAFVSFIVAFALIYYVLYRRHPDAFLFSSQAQRFQRRAFLAKVDQKIATIPLVIDALESAGADLIGGQTIWDLAKKPGVPLSKDAHYRAVARTFGPSGGTAAGLEIYRQGRFVEYVPMPSLNDWEGGWQGRIARVRSEYEKQLEGLHARRSVAEARGEAVWSFWDFLYFSVITQTTVGYGDILPNSTSVRMVVVLQILIAYVILVVLLNVVLRGAA
jgi:hypothetical protein